jgi:acetyl/propionyl-CoA carboxylase alpha subunit
MKYIVQIENEKIVVEVSKTGQTYNFKLNGKPIDFDVAELPPDGSKSLLVSGKSFDAEIAELPEGLSVYLRGHRIICRVEEERKARLARLAGEREEEKAQKTLQAQMSGLVAKILVSAGQEVKEGQGVVVVEAMKMQNELKAPAEGTVKEIKVKEGETVEKDQVLVTFE